MAKFSYQAINQSGRNVTGTLEADSKGAVQDILNSRGLIPGDIRSAGQAGGWSMENINTALATVKAPDLILFSKQLATMLRAGVPILRIFQVLESQTENLKLRRIISTIVQDIQEGSSLAQRPFASTPGFFPRSTVPWWRLEKRPGPCPRSWKGSFISFPTSSRSNRTSSRP